MSESQRAEPHLIAHKFDFGACTHNQLHFSCPGCLQGHAARMERNAEELASALNLRSALFAEMREALEAVKSHGCLCMSAHSDWHSTHCLMPKVEAVLRKVSER